MEQALADLQAQLRSHEVRLQGATLLEQRVLQAEAGLAQASTIIGEQRRQLDDIALRTAARAVPLTPTPEPGLPHRGFVDTRAIGKPPPFTGELAADGRPEGLHWGQWAFLFRAYVGAYNATARAALENAETSAEPIIVDDLLEARSEELSSQVFYILALTLRGRALGVVQRVPEGNGMEAWRQLCAEYEPRLPGRFQAMLQALLSPQAGPDPVQSLYEWERRVAIYENQSGDHLSDPIKRAVLTSHLASGALRAHLNLHSARLGTYREAREESLSYLRVLQQHANQHEQHSGAQPMDLDALSKGKEGKGKDKWKPGKGKGGKDKDRKGKGKDSCFYCGRPGHRKDECRSFSAHKEAKNIQPDRAGAHKGKPVDKATGRRIPKESDKDKDKDVSALALASDDDEEGGHGYIFALTAAADNDTALLCPITRPEEFELLFDTAAARSVLPQGMAPDVRTKLSSGTALAQADGTVVKHFGEKKVQMITIAEERPITVTFEEKGVHKPILAADSVLDSGGGVWLHAGGSFIVPYAAANSISSGLGRAGTVEIQRKNGVFVIPVRRDKAQPLCPATAVEPAPAAAAASSAEPVPTAKQEAKSSEEAQVAFAKLLPANPTDDERAKHALTHVPFRTWCSACITGQAGEDKHQRRKKDRPDDRSVATLGLDYCFLSRDDEREQATALILALRPSNCVGASIVPQKGVCEPAVQCVLFYLEVWGVTAVTLKCDQECNILALVSEVRKRRVHPTMLEKAPKHDHKANGHIENTVGASKA